MLQKKQKMLQKQLKKKPNNTIHLVKNGFWLFRVRFLLLIIYTLNNSTIIRNIYELTLNIVYNSFLPTSRPHKASVVLEIQSKGRLKIAFRRPLLSIYREEKPCKLLAKKQTTPCFKIQREIAFAAIFVRHLKPVLPHQLA